MSVPDPAYLVKILTENRAETESLLEGLDPDAVIYPETEDTVAWTVKDVIGHLTAWEEEGVRGLQAFLERKSYFVEESTEDYNARQVARRKNFSYERILADWGEIRQMMIDTIAKISPEKMKIKWTFAWKDERGTIPVFVESMIDHEEEHRRDFEKVR